MKNLLNNSLPLVSVIVPCRNEEKFIEKCFDSIVSQDYPNEKLEILIVDGMSEDKTREILKEYQKKYLFIKVLDNLEKIAPIALNIGIKIANGEIIIRMDSHATYDKKYISKCVKYLIENNADNVGGTMVTLPENNSLTARAIALALSHPFGVGNSHFRMATKKLKSVDTVFGGCYRNEIYDE